MRETRDQFFIQMAKLIATRGTCVRRQVGGVAVNARGHVLSTGYNGVPAGMPHCLGGRPCLGATAPSGTALDQCLAVHAEVNLLSQCHNVWEIDTVYLTASPCFSCTKALISSGCHRIIFLEEYPHLESGQLWKSLGREWIAA